MSAADQPECLFVYGTLCDPGVVEALLGKFLRHRPATLTAYRRIEPQGCYPYVIADGESSVEGQLLLDVDAAALVALDAYEGEGTYYRRVVVDISVSGVSTAAWVYVGIAGAHPLRRG